MSNTFTQVPNCIIRDKKLTVCEKAVLFVIFSYNNCDKIFLSQEKISKEANISISTTIRALNSLKNKKYISTKQQATSRTLEYKLLYKVPLSQRKSTLSQRKSTLSQRKSTLSQRKSTLSERKTSNKSNKYTYTNKENIQKKNVSNKTALKEISLPEWLDKDKWKEWIQFRKELKKPLTPSTIKAQLKKLGKDIKHHTAIIDQSIERGWMGLFPLKEMKTEVTYGREY